MLNLLDISGLNVFERVEHDLGQPDRHLGAVALNALFPEKNLRKFGQNGLKFDLRPQKTVS